MSRIYIAAPYPLRDEMVKVMKQLEDRGHVVTSRWLREPGVLNHEWAIADLYDVARADILLFIQPPEWENTGTGDRHVEMGYAIALNKEVVMLGEKANVFHYLNGIRHITDLEEL